MNGIKAMKTAVDLIFRDRSLTEAVTYQRSVGTDFDPAGQSAAVTTQDSLIRVLPRVESARIGPGGRGSEALTFLIRAADLPAEPAPGDRIVRAGKVFLMIRSEKDPSGLLYQVWVEEV